MAVALAFIVSLAVVEAQAQLAISTLAGSTAGGGYQDGQGLSARFSYPIGVAVDANVNLYIADRANHVIRKVVPNGTVTTLAGLGGHDGTANGQGQAARFNQPFDVAVDAAGNVFVADTYNHAIRKITPDGFVTTFAGAVGTSGTADGTGTAARFTFPCGIAVDSAGNLYVADTNNHLIRKITPAGVVTTLAGGARVAGSSDGFGTQARFRYPYGVTVDSSGNVYVADTENHTIRRITTDGRVTTIAGYPEEQGEADGTGSAARFEYPWALDVDPAGNLYVADTGNQVIRKITPAGVVSTIVGHPDVSGTRDGVGTAAYMSGPSGIAYDPLTNGFFVAERYNMAIRYVDASLQTGFFVGSFPRGGVVDGVGTAARFFYPEGITGDPAGNVYVSEAADTIRKITPDGRVTTFAGSSTDPAGAVDGPGLTGGTSATLNGQAVGLNGSTQFTPTQTTTYTLVVKGMRERRRRR